MYQWYDMYKTGFSYVLGVHGIVLVCCRRTPALLQALATLAAAAAASASADGHYGGSGTCMGREANPSVYNFEIGGYPAKVISDGRLLFQPPDAFQDDPYLINRALEKNFQQTDPLVFEVRLKSSQKHLKQFFLVKSQISKNNTALRLQHELSTRPKLQSSLVVVCVVFSLGTPQRSVRCAQRGGLGAD